MRTWITSEDGERFIKTVYSREEIFETINTFIAEHFNKIFIEDPVLIINLSIGDCAK